MDVIVLKIGGSILRGPEDLGKVTAAVEAELGEGRTPVCVVSAMKGVTDRIVQALSQVRAERGFDPRTFANELYQEHVRSLPAGVDPAPLRREFDKLRDVLSYVRSSGELGDSVYAYTVSRGENFAMRILQSHLEARGVRSGCFYGEDLLVTDEKSREAAVTLEKTKQRVEELLLPSIEDGVVPVVAGFAGRSESGLVTVFGRGGTDDTAACLAYCLGVKRLVKYVDEGGIMSLDPKFCSEIAADAQARVGVAPKPRLIPYMSYVEASELLREERTKVVHFKVLNPLMKGGISLQLKAIGSPGQGTVIGPENGGSGSGRPKAISFQRDLHGVRVLPTQSVLPTEVYAELFGALAEAGVDVRYVSMSGYQISLLVSRQDADIALRALRGLASAMEVKPIEGLKGTISVIGSEMRGVKGFLSRLTGALAAQGVNIEQATQPLSENIIRFSVADEDIPLAVAAVHREFFGD